jgi:hypothetical protein
LCDSERRDVFSRESRADRRACHHPDISKALSCNKVFVGRDAVAADLGSTLLQYRLEFVENDVESLLIENNTAVEEILFTTRELPSREAAHFLQGPHHGRLGALSREPDQPGLYP